MITPEEYNHFIETGYWHVPAILTGSHMERIQAEFDRVWDLPGPSNQHQLLQHKAFIDLIEHSPKVDRHRALFGSQTQLLQYDLPRRLIMILYKHAWMKQWQEGYETTPEFAARQTDPIRRQLAGNCIWHYGAGHWPAAE